MPTAARIPAGAIVEREVEFELDDLTQVRLALRNPDFTTAERIATGDQRAARAPRPRGRWTRARWRCRAAAPTAAAWPQLLTEIEQLPVEPDTAARIVIDERSGIIVMGDNVRISRVAVAQGNLTVRVTETPQVSQPNPLAEGRTVEVPRTNIEVERPVAATGWWRSSRGVTLSELVDGLNALGVGPRDLIGILQAIKAAGALQAEIEVM